MQNDGAVLFCCSAGPVHIQKASVSYMGVLEKDYVIV